MDLAAGLGALQLSPSNAERQLRIERALALVYGLPHDDDRPRMSSGRWRKFLNRAPIVVPGEDPSEDVFTDSVVFTGGSYVVFRGILKESAEIAQLLLSATFLNENDLPTEYRQEMEAMAYASLRVSDAIAERSGLLRNAAPQRASDGRLVIPPSGRFASLRDAVTFDAAELAEIIDPVSLDVLDPLVAELGQSELDPGDEADVGYPYTRPVVSHGDSYVVSSPSGLTLALRHRMVVRAIESAIADELARAFREASAKSVAGSLRRFSWSQLEWDVDEVPESIVESFWSFDVDKIAHVQVVADDLNNYQETGPFGRWTQDFGFIEDRILRIRTSISADMPGVENVLHLVVLQGIGRQSFVGLTNRITSEDSSTILISQPDLAVLARFEQMEPLALWKFTQAQDQLRSQIKVLAWSALDEYAVFRDARHSFCLSDERPPTHVTISSSSGADLRLDDAVRFDFHGAGRLDGSIVEVERRWEGTDAPIYGPDPTTTTRTELVLEGHAIPIWIDQSVEDPMDSGLRTLYFEFCDAIAYWLWQASETIKPIVDRASDLCEAIRISVAIDEPDRWGRQDQEEGAGEWFEIDNTELGVVAVRLFHGAQIALAGPENQGERDLLAGLLDALDKIGSGSETPHTDLDIPTALDMHAPLGLKKKLVVLDMAENLELMSGPLPNVRTIQDYDAERFLDQLGPQLANACNLVEGPIALEDRNQVLKAAVRLSFEELERSIAQLSSVGLLEQLMARHEALIRAYRRQQLTLPTCLACFGAEPQYLDEIHEHLDDLRQADLAARFLIEYSTAVPPSGELPLSLSRFDALLALAHQVISKGMLSDAVHYDFGDIDMSLLPSGRLGTDKEGRYLTGTASFKAAKARRDTQAAHSYFAQHWRGDVAAERPASPDDLDVATEAEFGINMTDLGFLIEEFLSLGLEMDREPKLIARAAALTTIETNLGWPREKIELGLENLTLSQRAEFVPDGQEVDVYPWRFNRELSYVRRPILVMGAADADQNLLWGTRHLDRVGPNTLSLIQSGRLKARSPEMRHYVGSMRSLKGEAFNDLVADALQALDHLIVRRRVTRLGRLRIERSPAEPMGDLDVLVVDQSRRRIYALETKDFEQARTPAELRNEIDNLVADNDSAVSHHTERITWLRDHIAELLDWLSIVDSHRSWRIEGMIVVSRHLLAPHFSESPIPIVAFDELLDHWAT